MQKVYESGIKLVKFEGSGVPVKNPFMYDVVMSDISIAAGEERGVIVDVSGYQNVYVMAVGESATFDVNSYASPNASDTMPAEPVVAATVAGAVQGKVAKLAPSLYLTIKNTTATAAKFTMWVYAI